MSNLYCTVNQKCETIGDGCQGPEGGRVRGLDGVDYDSECDAFWKGRVDYLCHYSGGAVCDVEAGVTYATECDAVDAGVTAIGEGACDAP